MNPRQRRGVLLLVTAVAGSVAVFLGAASYLAQVRSQVQPLTTVLMLTGDVPAYAAVDDDLVDEQEVPSRWVPDSALRSRSELVGLVAAGNLPAGSLLQAGMLTSRPDLEHAERELAILVDAETGVAGKIGPGSVVDIYATFPADEHTGTPPCSGIVVTAARIIDVGSVTSRDEGGSGFGEERVVPVTFALSVRESLVLAYVESFATKVRLGLRAPGDETDLSVPERVFTASPRRGADSCAGADAPPRPQPGDG